MNDLQSQNLIRLGLKFGSAVDRRTIGKVLTSGAALFNASRDSGDEMRSIMGGEGQGLRELDVQLVDVSDGADQVYIFFISFSRHTNAHTKSSHISRQAIYKVFNTILPRYHGLVALRLRFSHNPSSSGAQVNPDQSIPSERDSTQFKLWSKHCPSLQSIQLLSGAMWRRT